MKGHKWFAAAYDRLSASLEKKYTGSVREELLKGVSGDVLEIGAGTGANFRYYRNGARVVATEPDPYMMERARQRAAEAPVNIELRQAAAEELPFPDGSFDMVVDTLVLCSVQDQAQALSEVKRVLKPGGEMRLYEHVRYEGGFGAVAQDAITPVWRWLGAGCHPNRDTARAVREAGFEIVSERREPAPVPVFVPSRPHLWVVARRAE
ncbi:MAG TPA: class I SAM-dependent methyltransferase [Dehalococcoidia bacterium]|nr:class I SAM-dependent methyltransferase [Dehalococcoidia bacterium]